MVSYSLEKILYFASQRLEDGFHVDSKEERKNTTLWNIAKECFASSFLRKKSGSAPDRYFLTLAGYAALVSLQEDYKTKKGYTSDAAQLSQLNTQLHAAFKQGVAPDGFYTPAGVQTILAGLTMIQALHQAEQTQDFALRNITPGEMTRIVNEAKGDALLQQISEDTAQLTRKGRAFLHEAQRYSSKLMGTTLSSGFWAKREKIQTWTPPVLTVTLSEPVNKVPEQLAYALLKESEHGSVAAVGALFADERRPHEEQQAIKQLISIGQLKLLAEDDAGAYYALTSDGRIRMMEIEKLTTAETSLRQSLEQDIALEKMRKDVPLHGEPMVSAEDLMRDLSLYRRYTLQLASLHLTAQEMNSINELAIDIAFEQHELPGKVVEEWRKTSHLRTDPSILHERREQAIEIGIGFLSDKVNVNDREALPIDDFRTMLKQQTGSYIPWHEGEALLRESFYRLRQTLSPTSPGQRVRPELS